MFDFDNDGFPDIYFVNGAEQPSLVKNGVQYCNRLYRNKGDWTFEDVTEKAGVCGHGYNFGVATADFDNDGFADILITSTNGNLLYRNSGDGTFEDVTEKAGVKGSGWSTAAAWFDYDNDGFLDLFAVRYIQWDSAKEMACGDAARNLRTYCHPRFYEPLSNQLFHNNGDGTFTDTSEEAGISAHRGKGMGIAIADYDHDGRMDAFVTNDTLPNFLFHNEGKGKLREVGLRAGVALNDDGKPLSSMGVDFRDLDNDSHEDIVMTALSGETFPFFHNMEGRLFADHTYPTRIGQATANLSGVGNRDLRFRQRRMERHLHRERRCAEQYRAICRTKIQAAKSAIDERRQSRI